MPATKFNKANFSYFFGVSFISLLSVFVFTMTGFITSSVISPVKQQAAVYVQTTESPITKKVLVLDFNPVLTTQANKKLTEYKNWNNPKLLEAAYIEDVRNNSGSYVNYQVVEHKEINDFPVKKDGFDYNETNYLNCLSNNVNCHSPDLVDYKKILADNDVCGKRNRGEIDELWLWGGPYFGYYESTLAGPNLFWYNSDPLADTGCNQQLPIMGFNFERGTAEMLEDLGHRVEAVMTQVYGSWERGKETHAWDRFTLIDKDWNGRASCGFTHFAPNSENEYQYDNQRFIDSTCNNWFNFPGLSGAKQSINCTTWGCDSYGFKKWWLNHLPRFDGVTDGRLNNWWRYVLNYDEALEYLRNRRCDLPGVPNNVKAVSGSESGQITLSWDKSDKAKYYSISYGLKSLNYTWGAANLGDVNTYVVSQLEPGKPYYFLIMAHNDCGSSGALQEVAAYAGKGETTYWVAPEIVYLPLEKLPSATESASPSPVQEATSSPSPSAKAKSALALPNIQIPPISNGAKLLIVGLVILAALALIGKRIIEKETVESSLPPITSNQPPETTSWPPPEAINVSDEQMADQLPKEDDYSAPDNQPPASGSETSYQSPRSNDDQPLVKEPPEPFTQ